MKPINYTLTFNQSLRWTDERSQSRYAASSKPVYAQVKKFVNSIDYLLTISNPNINFVGLDKKCYSIALMASCGYGTLSNDIFGLLRPYDYDDMFWSHPDIKDRIVVGFAPEQSSIILCAPKEVIALNEIDIEVYTHWCNILFAKVTNTPLALVIPLTKTSD